MACVAFGAGVGLAVGTGVAVGTGEAVGMTTDMPLSGLLFELLPPVLHAASVRAPSARSADSAAKHLFTNIAFEVEREV